MVVSYLLFGGFFAGKVLAEEIKEFGAKIYINKDGTVDVEEKIVYDFGEQYRHGIFRQIPFVKINQQGKKFILDFKNFKVVDEVGKSYRFTSSKEGERIKLKIGDPQKTISGTHTYIISYKVAGALTYFSDHDELYWNVTGNEWEAVIEVVKAAVYLPQKIEENDLKTKCYTGSFGSTLSDCQIYYGRRNGGEVIFQTTRSFLPNEGLTVVLGFPKNMVSVLEPKEYKSFWETFVGKLVDLLILLLVFIWYLGLPIYIVYRWFKYGRDPKSEVGVVSAWFDPPKTSDGKRFLTPAEVGVLGDETVDLKDISATIVDLARRGFLRIEERKKDVFYLKKLENDKSLLSFERLLIDRFFKSKKEIRLRKGSLYEEVEEIKKAIYKQVVEEGLFPEDPQKIRTMMTVLTTLGLVTGSLFLAFAAFVFGRNLPRKTKEGVKAKNIAFSLRNFLRSQERQLTFQADKQMMFEKLLPYAVVFGVEKIWAKRFADLDLKPPEWYLAYDQRRFNSVIFTNNLNSSLSSFKSAALPPTSTRSTSGFFSGFSGGFSGGGGGGGGGGSW